ncbi:MAG TPA: nodulation protein NfeD [Terriglobia bacterium]|nr:nodulation protein NfeD [Terriglobia bacterium]
MNGVRRSAVRVSARNGVRSFAIRAAASGVLAWLLLWTAVPVSLAARGTAAQAGSTPVIVEIDLDDIVHPVSADYVREGLKHAGEIGARAVILRIDTPGGLIDSMRDIVESVLSSPVPVIAWVGPNGARAASAGFFILLSADVAVMSPGTNTGAAHPISSDGSDIGGSLKEKIVNDAAAYLRSYVTQRGRNAAVAETGVLQSKSFTAEEALHAHLIDAVVNDAPDIIRKYDGAAVRRIDQRSVKLDLEGATIEPFEMSSRQQLLSRVLNPNIALILAVIGLVGLYVEITHPGLILPGVAGAIAIILALFAFNLLPVNWAGAALILVAIALFVMEATITSHGILALGGIVAMIAGGLMLVEGPIPQLRISLATILGVTFPLAAITVFLVRLVALSHARKSVTGGEGMIGEIGVARTDVHAQGTVFVHGELWKARSTSPIESGATVRVVRTHGLEVEVEKQSETNSRN